MGKYVFHKVRGVWTPRFKTRAGAVRVAKRKYPRHEVYEPYNLGGGRGWHVRVSDRPRSRRR